MNVYIIIQFLEYCKVEDLDGGEVKFIREGFEKRVSILTFFFEQMILFPMTKKDVYFSI